jgi:hypothetical protein
MNEAAPEKAFWISWQHYMEAMGPFELHSPWWVSGYGNDEDGPYDSICAAVRANDEEAAKALVAASYDDAPDTVKWRFCEPRPDTWTPFCERFPKTDWMKWSVRRQMMGAWGYRPMDNDGAMDLFGAVEDAAGLAVAAIYSGGHGIRGDEYGNQCRWARLGVVQLMLESKFSLPKRVVHQAVDDCKYFLEGEHTHFETFKKPGEAKRATQRLLKKLEGMRPEMPFGLPRAISKGTGPKLSRKPKRKATASKPKANKKPRAKTVRRR